MSNAYLNGIEGEGNVIEIRPKSRITLKVERPWELFFSTLIYDLFYPLQVQPRQNI